MENTIRLTLTDLADIYYEMYRTLGITPIHDIPTYEDLMTVKELILSCPFGEHFEDPDPNILAQYDDPQERRNVAFQMLLEQHPQSKKKGEIQMNTITVILNDEELFNLEHDGALSVEHIVDNLESYIAFEDLDVKVEYFDNKKIKLKTY